jgi:gliding motility-associated-like protein
MNLYKILFPILLSFGLSSQSFGQYITVSENKTVNELVEDILINSPCANVTNISVTGFNQGSGDSYGYFTAGTSAFPFADGIILSSGRAASAIGPNSGILSEGPANGWPGDNDLNTALDVTNSKNATILEFDFQPVSNKISFEYIFASEQYLTNPTEFQCGFTDGFVFLLKEANTSNTYQNLAVIPGTTIPVKVNTVRGPGTICPPENEFFFGGFNGFEHPTNFNGQTKTLIAQANVIAGITYHIKIVVADQGNEKYDSAIFLKGGSFNIGVNLDEDRLFATQNPLCDGGKIILNGTVSGASNYKWYKDGSLLIGESNPTYEVTSAGSYKAEVIINSTCTATDEIVIEYAAPIVSSTETLLQCDDDNDGISTFNLSKIAELIAINLTIEDYYLTQIDAENEVNKVQNPTNFVNSTTNQVVVRVRNEFGCIGFITLQLQIANNVTSSVTKEYCDEDNNQDGLTQFSIQDFDAISLEILVTLPSGYSLSYHTTIQDAVLQTNAISFPFSNTIASLQTLFARIINGADCYGIIPVNLIVNTFSPLNFEDKTIGICSGIPEIIGVETGFSSYIWNSDSSQTSNQISVTQPGTYIVEVTNAKNCKATKTFFVTASESAIIGSISIDDFNGQNNSVLINYTGIGDYEFSLDGITFQDSNYFTNIPSGEYTIYVIDKKGCDTVKTEITVITFPTFFTPNGDGFNDTWTIKNIDVYPNSKLEIFDRYGKLLKNLSANDSGWNGKLSNENLPADDYWFILTLNTKREIKGHFSLKR